MYFGGLGASAFSVEGKSTLSAGGNKGGLFLHHQVHNVLGKKFRTFKYS